MTDNERHLAARQFEEFVKTIAENNRERDGSNPEFVANSVIVAPEYLGEEYEMNKHALRHGAMPYYDVWCPWPKDILQGSAQYPYVGMDEDASLREIAVEVLADAIADYYDRTSWDQNGDHEIQR